jgi:hypothetical protein
LALVPDWAVPARAEGETEIPFTDYPASYKPNSNPSATNQLLHIRTIDGYATPSDQFSLPSTTTGPRSMPDPIG